MSEYSQDQDLGFVVGLLPGTFVGAALIWWLAPKASAELRQRVGESAKICGHARRASATGDRTRRRGG